MTYLFARLSIILSSLYVVFIVLQYFQDLKSIIVLFAIVSIFFLLTKTDRVKSLYFFVILLLIIPQGAFDIFLINLPAVHKVTPYVIIQSCLALTGAMAINKDAPIFKFYAIKYMVVAF